MSGLVSAIRRDSRGFALALMGMVLFGGIGPLLLALFGAGRRSMDLAYLPLLSVPVGTGVAVFLRRRSPSVAAGVAIGALLVLALYAAFWIWIIAVIFRDGWDIPVQDALPGGPNSALVP